MKKRFRMLKVLATILKVFGVVVAALSLVGGVGSLIMSFVGGDLLSSFGYETGGGILIGLASAVSIVIFGMLYAVVLYGYGELLLLLLAVEDNTFRTVKLLEDVIKEE